MQTNVIISGVFFDDGGDGEVVFWFCSGWIHPQRERGGVADDDFFFSPDKFEYFQKRYPLPTLLQQRL